MSAKKLVFEENVRVTAVGGLEHDSAGRSCIVEAGTYVPGRALMYPYLIRWSPS